MYLAALKRLALANNPQLTRLASDRTRQFSSENVDFMEKFARTSFQNTNIKQPNSEQGKNYMQKKKQRQPSEDVGSSDLLTQAYIQEFGKAKGDLLQDWLQMSHDDLVMQCKQLQIGVSDKLNENIQGLFDYLNKFESDTLAETQSQSAPTTVLDGVFKKFGMKKQEQMDKWLDLPNSDLMAECQKYGLPVSEKHIHNIQALFNYLKSFDYPSAKQKTLNYKAVDRGDYQESQTKQFHRKSYDKQNWDQQAQSEAAISEVEADLSKIFNRKTEILQTKTIQKSRLNQNEEIIKGPITKLPQAPNFITALKTKLQCKPSSFVDAHVGYNSSDRHMLLEQINFTDKIAEQQKQHDLVDKVFQMSPDSLLPQLETMQGSKHTEAFQALSNMQKRATLLNFTTVNFLKAELNVDAKLVQMLQNKDNILPFANANFSLLNQASRILVKDYVVKILQIPDKDSVLTQIPTVKHLNSIFNICGSLGLSGTDVYKHFVLNHLLSNSSLYQIKPDLPLLPQMCDLSSALNTIDEQTDGLLRGLLWHISQEQFNKPSSDQVLQTFAKTEFTPDKLKNLSIKQLANLVILCKDNQIEPLMKQICTSVSLAHLSNSQLIFLMQKTIDINNKSILGAFMRGMQEQVLALRFDLAETTEFVNQLARLGNHADVQLVQNFMEGKPKQIFYSSTAKDLSKSLDLLTTVYKSQPWLFKNSKYQIKLLIQSAAELMKKEVVPLREMVRLATFLNPSVSKPVFLLEDIVQSSQSLAKDVPEQEVELLVNAILGRAQQHRTSFDHLRHSFSVIHSEFVPYAGDTFQFLKKVIDDKVSCRITNKIAADSFVASRLFLQTDQAEKTCSEHLQKQIDELASHSVQMSDFMNIFHMISNFSKITQSEHVKSLSKQLYEATLLKLKENLVTPEDGIQSFQELLLLNYAIMHAVHSFDNREELFSQYCDKHWFSQVIDQCLRQKMQLQKGTASTLFQLSPQMEEKIMTSAKNISWSQLERQSSHLLKYFLVQLESTRFSSPQVQELVSQYILKLQRNRSLHGEDLANMFLVIEKLQPSFKDKSQLDLLLMNLASNLRTIGVKLMHQNAESQDQENENLFKTQNASILEEDRSLKKLILDQYMQIYARNPALFQEQKYSLAPLSNLMAQLFDTFEHEDVLNCMNLLSATNIDNYSEEFILKLYENYAQQAFMAQMYDQNPKFFLEFSKSWPRFLRNNAIQNQLTRVKGQSVLVSDQSETLQILTRRNVLHPQLMNMHLDTFIRMKDRDQVSKYLRQFLESAAYFGYTNDVNVEQLTQVFRRIHRSPAECDMEELLNFLVVLAISKSYYQDFDEKSRIFIDQALDLVESSTISQQYVQQTADREGVKYSGTQHLIATRPKDLKEDAAIKSAESLETEQEFKLSFFQQIPTSTKTYNKQAVINISKKISEETDRARTAHFQVDSANQSADEEEENAAIEAQEEKTTSDEDEQEAAEFDGQTKLQQKSARKSYERKGSESQYQEDFEYLQYRNKKLAEMNKKDKHLLVYSNINQLNFVDINQKSIAKAWTILFHFRAKSLQSMLFEEFNSISQRNAVGKTKSHDLFSKLYLKLMEQSHDNGYMIQMANSCDRTGWPIDISIRFKESKTDKTEQHAIYFMLQEELCYNAQTQSEEPLGLQKLMVRHLQTISDYKVHFVTENEAQAGLESVVERLLEKMGE